MTNDTSILKDVRVKSANVAHVRGVDYKLLTAGEEADLIARAKLGDRAAVHRLVDAHEPMIQSITSRLTRMGPGHDDAMQEGRIGLMRGIAGFDPTRGLRLSTYARFWVRAQVFEHLRDTGRIIRLGASATQRRLAARLPQARRRLGIYDDRPSASDARMLAEHLDASVEETLEMCARLAPNAIVSLDAPLASGADAARVDSIADERGDVAVVEERIDDRRRIEAIRSVMDTLPERQRDIIASRYLRDEAESLDSLGGRLGITRQRVNQLELKALETIGMMVPASLSHRHGERPKTPRRVRPTGQNDVGDAIRAA